MGQPKMDGSWWRVLTKYDPLEKGMANHFSILECLGARNTGETLLLFDVHSYIWYFLI